MLEEVRTPVKSQKIIYLLQVTSKVQQGVGCTSNSPQINERWMPHIREPEVLGSVSEVESTHFRVDGTMSSASNNTDHVTLEILTTTDQHATQ